MQTFWQTFWTLFIAPFADFGFMRRALVGVLALSLSGSPLGVFLVLRRLSLTGDAMAHAILPGAAIGYLISGLSLWAMTIGGLVAGCVVALLAGLVTRVTTLREDASLATFYLISLALGVTIVSLKGSSIDLMHVLFGSVLALDDATLYLLAAISSLTLMGLAVIYRALVMETLDPGFLASVSRLGGPVQLIFMGLMVLNLVAGFHALGTLMAVGLMMLPAASARLWTREAGAMIGLAMVLGLISGTLGLVLSFHLGLPSGPAIILVAGFFHMVSLALGRSGGMIRLARPTRHLRA